MPVDPPSPRASGTSSPSSERSDSPSSAGAPQAETEAVAPAPDRLIAVRIPAGRTLIGPGMAGLLQADETARRLQSMRRESTAVTPEEHPPADIHMRILSNAQQRLHSGIALTPVERSRVADAMITVAGDRSRPNAERARAANETIRRHLNGRMLLDQHQSDRLVASVCPLFAVNDLPRSIFVDLLHNVMLLRERDTPLSAQRSESLGATVLDLLSHENLTGDAMLKLALPASRLIGSGRLNPASDRRRFAEIFARLAADPSLDVHDRAQLFVSVVSSARTALPFSSRTAESMIETGLLLLGSDALSGEQKLRLVQVASRPGGFAPASLSHTHGDAVVAHGLALLADERLPAKERCSALAPALFEGAFPERLDTHPSLEINAEQAAGLVDGTISGMTRADMPDADGRQAANMLLTLAAAARIHLSPEQLSACTTVALHQAEAGAENRIAALVYQAALRNP